MFNQYAVPDSEKSLFLFPERRKELSVPFIPDRRRTNYRVDECEFGAWFCLAYWIIPLVPICKAELEIKVLHARPHFAGSMLPKGTSSATAVH